MPGPYVTDEDVRGAINARIGNDPATVEPAHWSTISPRAISRGYQKILNALVKRGYSVAAIDQWDGRKQYNLDLAVAIAMTQRGFGNDDDRSALFKEIDGLEKELTDDELILTNSVGQIVQPDLTEGIVAATSGRLDAFDQTVEKVKVW